MKCMDIGSGCSGSQVGSKRIGNLLVSIGTQFYHYAHY